VFADGTRLSVELLGELALPPNAPVHQSRVRFEAPVIVTSRASEKLQVNLVASALSTPPIVRFGVGLVNKTGEPLRPVLRIRADGAHGAFRDGGFGFVRDDKLLALVDLGDARGEIAVPEPPRRHVFRRQGGQELPNWGHPKVACDRGFSNIVAGMAEPATYFLKAEPGKSYVVAVGLCESHWKAPGNRILDLLIEGQKVATVDPVKPPYGTDVPFVLTFPATDRDQDGWISVSSVANAASPDVNPILNVLWLFEESVAKGLTPADIVAGRANGQAACYVDCGGPAEGWTSPRAARRGFSSSSRSSPRLARRRRASSPRQPPRPDPPKA
jgi:hypothetical protein